MYRKENHGELPLNIDQMLKLHTEIWLTVLSLKLPSCNLGQHSTILLRNPTVINPVPNCPIFFLVLFNGFSILSLVLLFSLILLWCLNYSVPASDLKIYFWFMCLTHVPWRDAPTVTYQWQLPYLTSTGTLVLLW